jgi:ribosomal protein S12 methylthiotransferase accessory factor
MNEDEAKGLEELLSLYSPQGLLRKAGTYLGPAGSLPIPVGNTEYYDLDYIMRRLTGLRSLNTGTQRSLFAGGKGTDIPHMLVSGLGEAVERIYGSLTVFEQEFVYGTYREMMSRGHNCLGPADVPLFAKEQYASGDLIYEPFTEDCTLGWLEGHRLISGESVWMPAQLIVLFYPPRKD